ncbi:MAG: hypothetical protein K5978_08430 [Campylobacter sp.]|nr:hypothetical protein [Campylobacter sp.]
MPSINIKKAAQNKDVFKIRSYLIADILVDKNLSGIFKEDFEYCLKNGISKDEIYEKHDDKILSNEVSEENYDNLHADLASNFSKERVDALKKIAIKLYPPKPNSSNSSSNYQKHGNSDRYVKTDKEGNKFIYAIAAGVAVLIGIILFTG